MVAGEDISSQQSGSAFIRAELLIVCGQTTDKQWAVRHQHQAAPCRIIIATSSAEIAGLVLVVRIRNFRHDYQEIMTRHSHNHPHYHPDELSCTQEVSKHQQQVARTSTAAEIATNLRRDFTIMETRLFYLFIYRNDTRELCTSTHILFPSYRNIKKF